MSRTLQLQQRRGAATDKGPRRVNEDAVLVADLPGGAELAAVADGMGGQLAGEVASRTALEVLRDTLASGLGLREAVVEANRAVRAAAAHTPEHSGMGTTLVALHRQGDQYVIANVGDSRAYRVDEKGVRQLTRDHSFLAEAVASGQLTEEAAQQSPWRHAVTRAIGPDEQVEVDCFGPFDATEHHAVLLCTDGLYRVLDPPVLHDLALGAVDAVHATHELCAAAVQAGTNDNASAALVRFGAPVDQPSAVESAPSHAVENGQPPAPPAGVRDPQSSPVAEAAPTPRTVPGALPVPVRAPPPPPAARPRRRWRPRHRWRWFGTQALIVLAALIALAAYVSFLRVAL